MGEYPPYGLLWNCGLNIKENVYEACETAVEEGME